MIVSKSISLTWVSFQPATGTIFGFKRFAFGIRHRGERTVLVGEHATYIFSLQAKRVLSKNLTFQYKSSAFQVRSESRGYRLRHSVVTVCENFDGEINVLYDGKALGWEKYVDGPEPIPLDDEKSVHERVDNARIDLRSKYYVKPKADHPWLTRRTQSHQQVKPPKLPKKKPDPDKKD